MPKRSKKKLVFSDVSNKQIESKENTKSPIYRKIFVKNKQQDSKTLGIKSQFSVSNINTNKNITILEDYIYKPAYNDEDSDSDFEIFPLKRTENTKSPINRKIFVKQQDSKTSRIKSQVSVSDINPNRKITILEDNVCKPANYYDEDSDSDLGIFPVKRAKPALQILQKELSPAIYASPSNGRTFSILQNINITPTQRNTIKQSQKKYFCENSPGGVSLGNLCGLSRSVSLNDISDDNLIQISLPLDEQNIRNYILTPTINNNQVIENNSQIDSGLSSLVVTTKAEVHEEPKNKLNPAKPAIETTNISTTNERAREFQYSLDVIHDSCNPENDTNHNDNDQENIFDLSTSVKKKQMESKIQSEDVIERYETEHSDDNVLSSSEEDKNSDEDECFLNDQDGGSSIHSSMLSCDGSSEDEEELQNECENDENYDEWEDISEKLPNIKEFIGKCIINVPTEGKTPFEIYKLFLTEDIIKKMVVETNNYAAKFIEKNKRKVQPKSRSNLWNSTDYDEMLRFLGALIVMGLNKVPHMNDYWSKKSIYRNEYICSVMNRDRFLLLLKFWHFSDDNTCSISDKLYKIRDILNMLLERFNNVLTPGKYVVIDETMIPWRGRLKFRQYIKNKTHKYGVKLYKICTPEGYTSDIIIYTGKGENGREINHGQKTVLKLVNKLKGQGRIIIADNFYTSIDLAEELLLQETFLCGTIKPNRRGLPKTVMATKLKKGEICGKMNNKGVRIIKWVDKRPVCMISTCKNHDTYIKDTGKTRNGTNEKIKKPECILTYNDTKKGIDYSDQMSSYYTTLKRGIKWYRKVVMELIFGTAMVNAWIIFNIGKDKRIPKKEFTEAIIESLTGKTISAATNDKTRTNHTLEKVTDRRRCIGCYNKLRKTLSSVQAGKKVKKVPTTCTQCQKYFCLPCFNEEHKGSFQSQES